MQSIVIVELVVLAVLLMLSGFFSSAETIFFSLNPLQIRSVSQRHHHTGKLLHHLLADPRKLLSTILIGNTVINVAVAAVGYAVAEHLFHGWGAAVSIPAVTILLVMFGEIMPKRIGLQYAEGLTIIYAPVLDGLTWILTPVRKVLEWITAAFEPLIRPHGRTLSEEEFETVLDIGGEEGVINSEELAMLKAIIQLEDLTSSDVMTPRVDIVGIDLDDPADDPVGIARKARRNHLLLYRDSLDTITGFLDVKKFLLDPQHNLQAATRPPYFVPESSPLNTLLTRMQNEKRKIAVVVDEYGGTAGLVTRGDILEEITGEIYQELSKPRPLFQPAGPDRWLVDANLSLEELNRRLDLDLEAEDVDRLAGWIAAHVGHLPVKDDVVEEQDVRVTVLQTVRLRVTLAMIEILEPPPIEREPGEDAGK